MTAAEFTAAIARLGLSQTETARFLRVNVQTVHRWTKGTRAVPPTIPLLLQIIEAIGLKRARKIIEG